MRVRKRVAMRECGTRCVRCVHCVLSWAWCPASSATRCSGSDSDARARKQAWRDGVSGVAHRGNHGTAGQPPGGVREGAARRACNLCSAVRVIYAIRCAMRCVRYRLRCVLIQWRARPGGERGSDARCGARRRQRGSGVRARAATQRYVTQFERSSVRERVAHQPNRGAAASARARWR